MLQPLSGIKLQLTFNDSIFSGEYKLTKEIVKREVRFAIHLPEVDGKRPDLHFIREDITYKDSPIPVPSTYFLEEFQRPVFVTKEAYRNHKDKKEFEERDKLNMQTTTQSKINLTVARLLNKPHLANSPNELKSSPYLYGYDISSTSFIKYANLKKNNFVQSSYSVAAFDIETDIDTEEILMATIVYQNKAHTVVLKKFLQGIPEPKYRLKQSMENLLPEYTNLEVTLNSHDNEVDMLKDIFRVANNWKPAFLAIWNMDFDIGRILERLRYFNVNPIDVICDQSIPRHLRVCRYKQGLKKKVTASGVVKPINPSLQWHTLISTSTFYVIDSMCVFRQLRMAQAERPSYSLDSILNDELNKRKLKFSQADEYKGAKWHTFLQKNYPIEYTVYNIYDCIALLELDQKNKDLSNSLPSFSYITDFAKFNSQVRKITDAMFVFGLERKLICGTVSKVIQEEEQEDEEIDENSVGNYRTLDLKGWIQLLPQNLLLNEGLEIFEDYPGVRSNARGLVCDLDCSSAYPSAILTANVSKSTCVKELINVVGVSEETFRTQNLGVCLGDANMLEYMNVMFNLPTLAEIDEMMKAG